MSKQIKRKITVNLSSKNKDISKPRPSVFERLGTKANSSQDICHHWAQNGTCPYGKGCKYSSTHTLISPSKQRAAKNQSESKRRKENAHKRLQEENGKEDSYHWDSEELADADPDDLEKRRQELQRELDLQMKMENKARKKDKKTQKESSSSTESSTSSSDSSSSSDDSSSSSSSTETRRKKNKKVKIKRESSSSSDERPPKKKAKIKSTSAKFSQREEKLKKDMKTKLVIKSPTPVRSRRQSQTPPLKIKPGVLLKTTGSKSPRPTSRSSDRKERHHTPSPKPKNKEKDRDKENERYKEKEREKDREKGRSKERIKETEREREKDYKKKEYRSPKRENKPNKESKKRDTPDSSHSRDRKSSPNRSKGGGSNTSKRENYKSPPLRDEKNRDNKTDKDRSRIKERQSDDNKSRRDKQESRDRDRDRERERDRRLTREEREAAREKEREEALARCQERQRERERLKELAKKEEERSRFRDRSRREDRNFDKQLGERNERLLPLTEDRIATSRKHSSEREKSDRRDREKRDRTPEKKKSIERREEKDRGYERNYDRSSDRNYDKDREREYSRIREPERRLEEKDYESPYDRTRHDDRRYLDGDDHYTDNSRDERLPLERDYAEERRNRRDHWDSRDDRDLELEHRRYLREDSRPPATLKGRDWETDYPDHDWDRARRPIDWDGRDNWDSIEQKHITDEEWRLYNWSADDRRRWQTDWREISRPRSSTSHTKEEAPLPDSRRKETSRQDLHSDRSDSKTSVSEVEGKKECMPSAKRPIDDPVKSPVDIRKSCVVETALEDDLSEISDDADEILNRDEEILESVTEVVSLPEPIEVSSVKEQASTSSQKSQSPNRSPHRLPKDLSIDEENIDLDFEEISEDELEEESRVKGIGDALGVDWASLIAESRPRVQPITSTKKQWDSYNVFMNLGLSYELAGQDLVEDIIIKHEEDKIIEKTNENTKQIEETTTNISGLLDKLKTKLDVKNWHKIGAIQVVKMEKYALRETLFCVAGLNCRALSARRDLMIRRHLCNLPLHDSYVDVPKRHDPELLQLAIQMFEKCL